MLKKCYKNIRKNRTNNIICINKTFLNSLIICQKDHSIIGTKYVIKTTNQEVFKRYVGIFAISSSTFVSYKIYKQGRINGERLLEFLQVILKDKKK